MKRAARLRVVCLAMAAVCCLEALFSVGSLSSPFLNPAAVSSWGETCIYTACRRTDLVQVPLRESARVPELSAEAKAIAARAARPETRAYLALGELVRVVPYVIYFLSLAVALRELAKGKVFERRTVRWLRRAAGAALVSIAADVAAFYIQTAILTGFAGDFVPELGSGAVDGFIFASVAWVVAWALEQGVRTRDELAGYV